MSQRQLVLIFVGALSVMAAWLAQGASPQQSGSGFNAAQQREFLDRYCVSCHNQNRKTAGLFLDQVNLNQIPETAATWEKVLKKLRGGMMPPLNSPRPDKPTIDRFAASLETQIDKAYFARVNPGRVGLHRLNRAEYQNAIRDLLAVNIDVSTLLPPDDGNFGFDNIADALTVSPSLLERYLAAAWKISRVAVGDPQYIPGDQTFRSRGDLSQHRHIEGLPLGTRGGLLADHTFPLDAEYVFSIELWRNTTGGIRGLELPSEVEITVDGLRVHLARFGGDIERRQEEVARILQVRLPVKAGPHRLGAAFVNPTSGPSLQLLQPYERERLDPITTEGIPEIEGLKITGPYNPQGAGDTPSRRRIFTCHANKGAEDAACARTILSTVARRAFRSPLTDVQIKRLDDFYSKARNEGGTFESAVEKGLAFILSSPEFLFRAESDPPNASAGAVHKISNVELASRLSFFLWSSIPDDELLNIAIQGRLSNARVLEQQVRRMLADPRSAALVSNFLGQWLYLRNLKGMSPDKFIFPDFDDNLRQAFLRETELFFTSIMREDRSVVDLLGADYTYVNERLARHYGIPNVYGSSFRRVTVTSEVRRGLLGHGSILTVTSQPNRTSPVLRGKFILTNILGTPPPEPPPNVPPFDEVSGGTVRERMEQHRRNPACANCHALMDPEGLALENFDAIGRWRTTDAGSPIDATGVLVDGTPVDGPVALRRSILSQPQQFVRAMTEVMLTYALGRGLESYDMPAVRAIATNSKADGYRFSSLVSEIVKSPPFQMRMVRSRENTPGLAANR